MFLQGWQSLVKCAALREASINAFRNAVVQYLRRFKSCSLHFNLIRGH